MQLTKRFFMMNALAVLGSIAFTVLAVIIFVAAYTKIVWPGSGYQRFKKNL